MNDNEANFHDDMLNKAEGLPRPSSEFKKTTDYALPLLWFMEQLGEAKAADVIQEFEQHFGNLIPQEHQQKNKSGNYRWKHSIRWAVQQLKVTKLIESGGYGIWRITDAGRQFLYKHSNYTEAKAEFFDWLTEVLKTDDDDIDETLESEVETAIPFKIPVIDDDDIDETLESEEQTVQPMTMADAAYTILHKAGGGPLHVSDILQQAREQYLIQEPKGRTPQLSLVSIMVRDGRFNNQGNNMWVLATPISSEDNDSSNEGENPITDYTPAMYAGPNVAFWRFYFSPRWWDDAYEHGAIGLPYASDAGVSVERIKEVRVGDRVVVWERGGKIRGVGIVTHPYTDIRESPNPLFHPNLFNGEYPLLIGLRWSEELTKAVRIGNNLREQAPKTYNRIIEHQRTITSITREDYTTLLSMLQIDDIPDSITDNETELFDLHTYHSFVQSLDTHTTYSASELLARARATIEGLLPDTNATDFVLLLRQLRLIISDDVAGCYRVQSYATSTESALLRLMALAYLHPSTSKGETYFLPARTIVPRLRAATDAQSSETFAPEVGTYGPQLLAWYAEARLVRVTGTTWTTDPNALNELPDNGPTTQLYNRFLRALLADLDGSLTYDLPEIAVSSPLPSDIDMNNRLRDLGHDLIIDTQIVKRICRSLLAGRHVVLSGPPGTGKTELAKRLPTLLWQEEPHMFTRLAIGLDKAPVVEESEQRQGYAVEVVTATEEWSVRDVIGGIGPRLDGDAQGGTLRYAIEHGHLTRVVLSHYATTEHGRKLPMTNEPKRQDYRRGKTRYRGVWLVIDEFTRAPIDAAFGSLLTTLSGSEHAMLAVPTVGGLEHQIPLPQDFRIIGTLNSFDRHFLNQMSEAMKRRFDFIDVMPPHPRLEEYEQGIAVRKALHHLHINGLADIIEDSTGSYLWVEGGLDVLPVEVDGMLRYTWQSDQEDTRAAMESFWYLFRAIRVFRKLGTAQIVAIYTNLFTGRMLGMEWNDALDTALADALADQLQVLIRDEQRVIDAYVEYAGDRENFTRTVASIVKELPPGRRIGFLYALREADLQRNQGSSIKIDSDTLTDEQLARIFALGKPLYIPTMGAFRHRLRDLLVERGL